MKRSETLTSDMLVTLHAQCDARCFPFRCLLGPLFKITSMLTTSLLVISKKLFDVEKRKEEDTTCRGMRVG